MTINKIGRYVTLGELSKIYNKKLICVTYNMTEQKTEYLSSDNYSELPCLVAIRMSSNIPLVFQPFKYMGNYYIDGGITDNFPIMKAQTMGEKIIGILLLNKDPPDHPKNEMIEYIFGILTILVRQITQFQLDNKKDNTTIITLQSNFISNNLFDFEIKSRDKLEMFSIGYQESKNVFEQK
jgi:NTE family protein